MTALVEPQHVESGNGKTVSTSTVRRFSRSMLRSLAPVVVALIVGGLVLRISGNDPIGVYDVMAREAFGDGQRFAATLTSATPLLFTGLAAAIAFRAGAFTLGAEAGFIMGGLTAAWLGTSGGGIAIVIFCLIGGALIGGLTAYPAAWLKSNLNVDEVVSTLMINFVFQGVAAWIVNAFLLAPGQANSSTRLMEASLARIAPPSQLSIGFIVAIVMIFGFSLALRRTRFGFELRQVGDNRQFAEAQGINAAAVIRYAMVAAGVIAGLGGAVHALGVVHRYVIQGFSASYGFTGIAVALLARRSAIGIIPAAVLFGAFASAGTTIQLFDNIPLDIVSVLQGTVMIFAVAHVVRARTTGRKSKKVPHE